MATILLVDDEPYVTAALATKLSKLGHVTVRAGDGLEGFNVAQTLKPQLVVSDLQMPNLDGLGMAKRLKQSDVTGATPVILLTGRGHLIPPAELEQTNVRHLLAKPFSARDVLERIEAALKPAA